MTMYSTFSYFYDFYILYSLGLAIVVLIVFYFFIKLYNVRTFWAKYLLIPFMIFSLSLWTIPKFIHHYIFSTETLCLNATLKYKDYIHRDDRVKIIFELDYSIQIPKQLQSFTQLDGVGGYEYNSLPKKGKKIKICGEVSKIGFSFDYVEAIKDENVGYQP